MAAANWTSDGDQAPVFGVDCVFLTCFESECQFLRSLLLQDSIRLHQADTLDEADFLLTITAATVLISDISFLDGSWRDALALAARLHPGVVCLLVAEEADRPYIEDATELGVFCVLWKPLTFSNLRRYVRAASEAALDRRQIAVAGPV